MGGGKQGGEPGPKPGVCSLPWGDHLDPGSLVIEKAGSEPYRGLHGAVGVHVDRGGDGAQSELCQLQLLIVRVQQLYL